MHRVIVDDAQFRTLHERGHSPTEIARLLSLPRSTVQDRLSKLALPSPRDTAPRMSTPGVSNVHNDILVGMLTDLHEVVTWWQERRATLQGPLVLDRDCITSSQKR